MQRHRLATSTGTCDYWRGGKGPTLLLIHGGWAGAEAHWKQVWDDLSKQHRVVAIDLPGVWHDLEAALPSYAAYSTLCAELLTTLDVTGAIVIGNSLGASIGWQLALDRPDLVSRLIMVNGFPPRKLPMRAILSKRPFRNLAVRSLAEGFYGPRIFVSGFAAESRVPAIIRANLTVPSQPMADVMFSLLCSVAERARQPRCPVDFIWGVADRLPNVTLIDGLKLRARTRGARLLPIPASGHLPQVENPSAFLAAVTTLLSPMDAGRSAIDAG